MRTIPAAFRADHYSSTKELIFVIELEFDTGDVAYFTSHTGTSLPVGAVEYQGYIKTGGISGTTQQINPDEGRSTIGSISVTLVDKAGDVSALIAAKDAAGMGIRRKRVRVYIGYLGMSWSTISSNLVQTQIVDDYYNDTGAIILQLSDVQRSMRTDIFDLQSTRLSAPITANQLLIPVDSNTKFATMMHGPTFTDAPNARVGYFELEDEVIRWVSTTTDATLGLCYVADQRGALGTKAVAHEVDQSSSTDQRPEVTEFVYLEMQAVKLIYALLTGNLYGQLGEELPDSWHLGIGGEYVRTNDFITIGNDLWDIANDDGFVVRFAGVEKQDAKKFIETELCLLCALYMPIYSTGELGLRQFTSVLSNAPYVWELNADNIVSHDRLHVDLRAINNLVSIEWNYDHIADKLTRQKILYDEISAEKYGESASKSLQFSGLHGSRHTSTTVEGLFDRLRDRYAGPPHKLNVRVLPYLNFLEVADVVKVALPGVRDPFTGAAFARAMEIQQVSVNWVTGNLSFQLFGSSQPATPIKPGNTVNDGSLKVIDDAWYTATGTNISSYGGVSTSLSGGVRHITGGSGLAGNDSTLARYYCDGDLEIDSGVTLPFTKNVILVVKGHLQINGTLDGSGRGPAGAASPGNGSYDAANAGVPGFIGPTVSGGGMKSRTVVVSGPSNNQTVYDSVAGYQAAGQCGAVPRLALQWTNGQFLGLPGNLQGTSGSSGHVARRGSSTRVAGGAGGAGGAGIVIVARGISFGAAGKIITSGANGSAGVSDGTIVGGTGAGGAPGGVYLIVDGLDNDVPDISHVEALFGASPVPTLSPVANVLSQPSTMVRTTAQVNVEPPYYSYYTGYGSTPPDLSGYGGAARVQYVPPLNVAAEDLPADTGDPLSVSAFELINTPATIAGNKSTIEVTVSPPGDSTYAYAKIYYRYQGSSTWIYTGPADDEWDFVVNSDGRVLEILARPVSIFGKESNSGVQTTLALAIAGDAVPPDVGTISVNYNSQGLLELTWEQVSDWRGVQYEIRQGVSWTQSVVLGAVSEGKFSGIGAASYWIKSRVRLESGALIYSANAATITITGNGYIQQNVVKTWDETGTGLTGTFSGYALDIAGEIRLDTTGDILTEPDYLAVTDVLGYGSIGTPGAYEIPASHIIDVGRDAPCSVRIVFSAYMLDQVAAVVDASRCTVTPQINIGNNAGTYAGWQDYKPGVYYGRYFNMRVVLVSLDALATPVIDALEFSVDVPDRNDTTTLALSSGGSTWTFSAPFNGGNGAGNTPVVTATILNASAGDLLVQGTPTVSSVSFQVLNGGVGVARTIHAFAQGY